MTQLHLLIIMSGADVSNSPFLPLAPSERALVGAGGRTHSWRISENPSHKTKEKLKSLKLEDHELDALAELPKPRKATKRVFQKLLGLWVGAQQRNAGS